MADTDKYVAPATYTDQELLDLYRHAYARISVSGQSVSVATPGGGTTTYTSADLPHIRAEMDRLQSAINGANSSIFGEIIFRAARPQ